MAEMIGFDYAFEELSLAYGQFITDAREGYPEGKFEKVTHHHPYKKDQVVLYFAAPEEITVLLKLKYGMHIVVRPAPKKPAEDDDNYSMKSMLSAMQEINRQKKYKQDYVKNNIWDNDYNTFKILKNRNSLRSLADIERDMAALEEEKKRELERQKTVSQKVYFDYESYDIDEDLISKFKRYYKKIENE